MSDSKGSRVNQPSQCRFSKQQRVSLFMDDGLQFIRAGSAKPLDEFAETLNALCEHGSLLKSVLADLLSREQERRRRNRLQPKRRHTQGDPWQMYELGTFRVPFIEKVERESHPLSGGLPSSD